VSVTITYSFSIPRGGNFTLYSLKGTFAIGTTIIGTVDVPLSANIQNGYGHASEAVTIPLSVIEKAFRQGSGAFTYNRAFTGQIGQPQKETASINIRITPESIAEFSLRRVELYFDGREKRSEAIVNRNLRGLKAYADIYFNGSGFLQGYWDVDGRIIENISRHVSFGAKVTITTPDIPGLPTFDPGFHIVRFVVTNPQPPFELPQIVYWVTAKEEPVKRVLNLVTPGDGVAISLEDEFRWDKIEGVSVYLVTFIKEDDKTIIFSALTRDSSYKIPPSVISRSFMKDTKYMWQVKGFDSDGNIVAESKIRWIKAVKM